MHIFKFLGIGLVLLLTRIDGAPTDQAPGADGVAGPGQELENNEPEASGQVSTGLAGASPSEQIPMQKRGALGKFNGGEGGVTFVAVAEREEEKSPTFEELYLVASKAFNWIVANNDRKDIERKGTCLVAAFWSSDDNKIYITSKARGMYFFMMDPKNKIGHRVAPIWTSRAQKWGRNRIFHAEDTAYYHFEYQRSIAYTQAVSDQANGISPTTEEGWKLPLPPLFTSVKGQEGDLLIKDKEGTLAETVKYNSDSMIVTWGYNQGSEPKDKETGHPIQPCNTGQESLSYDNSVIPARPSCRHIAHDLGVKWAEVLNPPPAEVKASQEAEDEVVDPVSCVVVQGEGMDIDVNDGNGDIGTDPNNDAPASDEAGDVTEGGAESHDPGDDDLDETQEEDDSHEESGDHPDEDETAAPESNPQENPDTLPDDQDQLAGSGSGDASTDHGDTTVDPDWIVEDPFSSDDDTAMGGQKRSTESSRLQSRRLQPREDSCEVLVLETCPVVQLNDLPDSTDESHGDADNEDDEDNDEEEDNDDEEDEDANEDDLEDNDDNDDDNDASSDAPPAKDCTSDAECSDPNCVGGGIQSTCKENKCVCGFPEAPEPTTPPNLPECQLRNRDPRLYSTEFCLCDIEGEDKTFQVVEPTKEHQIGHCEYTEMPTKTINPKFQEMQTMTFPCEICTKTGSSWDFAGGKGDCEPRDLEECKPPPEPKPTFTYYLSDTEVVLGTSINHEDENVNIGKTLAQGLLDRCPSDGTSCETGTFHLVDTSVVVLEAVYPMMLEVIIEGGSYNSAKSRDQLIQLLTSAFVTSANATCKIVDYKESAPVAEDCEDTGSLFRRTPSLPEAFVDDDGNRQLRPHPAWFEGFYDGEGNHQLRKRIDSAGQAPDYNGGEGTLSYPCGYEVNQCTGPKIIHAISGTEDDPYENDLLVSFKLTTQPTDFKDDIAHWVCESIITALTLLALKYAPKLPALAGAEDLESLAIEAICGVSNS